MAILLLTPFDMIRSNPFGLKMPWPEVVDETAVEHWGFTGCGHWNEAQGVSVFEWHTATSGVQPNV